MGEPLFVHDSDCCTYLGPWGDEGEGWDLYWCAQDGGGTHEPMQTVLARFGNAGEEYRSGWEMPHPALVEARRRAIDRGVAL